MNYISDAITDLLKVVMGLLAVFLMTIAILLCVEVARIYVAHAFKRTAIAVILWAALVGLIVLWGLAAILSNTLSGYLASWGFLAYVIVAEGCDLYAQRSAELPAGGEGGVLLGQDGGV